MFVWKSIWILAFGLPRLLSGGLDPNVSFGGTESLIACLVGVVLVPLVMPWGYGLEHYLRAPGQRWGEKQVTVRPPLPGDKPKRKRGLGGPARDRKSYGALFVIAFVTAMPAALVL